MGARQVGKTWLMEEFAKREFGEVFRLPDFSPAYSLFGNRKSNRFL